MDNCQVLCTKQTPQVYSSFSQTFHTMFERKAGKTSHFHLSLSLCTLPLSALCICLSLLLHPFVEIYHTGSIACTCFSSCSALIPSSLLCSHLPGFLPSALSLTYTSFVFCSGVFIALHYNITSTEIPKGCVLIHS